MSVFLTLRLEWHLRLTAGACSTCKGICSIPEHACDAPGAKRCSNSSWRWGFAPPSKDGGNLISPNWVALANVMSISCPGWLLFSEDCLLATAHLSVTKSCQGGEKSGRVWWPQVQSKKRDKKFMNQIIGLKFPYGPTSRVNGENAGRWMLIECFGCYKVVGRL